MTNAAGVSSTASQVRGRASHAEWQAKMQKLDADMKASDEDRRRSQVKWDRISKCMQEMGTPGEDPKCMDKSKSDGNARTLSVALEHLHCHARCPRRTAASTAPKINSEKVIPAPCGVPHTPAIASHTQRAQARAGIL